MNWLDYAILAIVGISAVISLVRGFLKEAISLVGWILAFWVALGFAPVLAGVPVLAENVAAPSLRHAIAFLVLFTGVLLVTGVVNFIVGKVVEKTGLTGTDRTLGIVFGVARGAVIVAILVLGAGMTAMPRDPWWEASRLVGHFERFAVEIRGLLPPDVASHIDYSQEVEVPEDALTAGSTAAPLQ